jgi:hypothetical protein
MSTVEDLEERISNLEIIVMGYQVILNQILPPEIAEQMESITQDFFNSTTELGGLKKTDFVKIHKNV